MKQINSLKQVVLLVAAMVAFCSQAFAQPMNGTYTIAGTSPDYSTLSAAISDLNSRGISGPVIFNIRDGSYSGTSWQGSINNISGASATNRITFRSQSGNKANVVITVSAGSSSNYIFLLNSAKYISVKDLTLISTNTSNGRVIEFSGATSYDSIANCTLEGPGSLTSSTSNCVVYGTGLSASCNNNTIVNNTITKGSYGIYWYGTSSYNDANSFINNTITANYYGSFYSYYSSRIKFQGNTVSASGVGMYYGVYCYYPYYAFDISANTINISGTSTMYGVYCYFGTTGGGGRIVGNNITVQTTSGTSYPLYNYYCYNDSVSDNVVNSTTTSGSAYIYMTYYSYAKVNNNTVKHTSASGTVYFYGQYGQSSTGVNEFYDNDIDIRTASYGTIYGYTNYFAYSSKMYDNVFYFESQYSSIFNYIGYYASGGKIYGNKIRANATAWGTVYAAYNIGGFSGCEFESNIINASSASGTVYGMYLYYMYAGGSIKNNVVSTTTTGTNYTFYSNYSTGGDVVNNTFHSNATGGGNYASYIYNTSGAMKFKNNIVSKTSTNGYAYYIYNSSYVESDYNNIYSPGNNLFYQVTPSANTNSLQSWRITTARDKNSLSYAPGFVDMLNNDFRIDPASPGAWAVNGRGVHIAGDTLDITGAPRAKTPTVGVPDLGAYEVTPTSTPPDAVATPVNPVANGTQVFTFGQDTVARINWGASVPATYTMRQYSGLQAAPLPVGVGRMYFYAAGTPSTWVHNYKPEIYYKDAWLGTIPTESEAVIARSSNGGAWEGYNYTNAATNTTLNILSPAANFDSVGSFTGVQNGRIGIRCVENPKGIAISNITAFVADIDWQAVFNPIGYQVIVKTNSKAPTAAEWNSSLFAPTNSLAAGGLTEDKKYFVFIRSICGVKDTSGYSLDSFETLITCHTPVITISDINDGRAVVSWTAVKTVTKYEYVMTKSAAPPSFGTEINKSAVLAPFLDDGSEYFVHVRAHCSSMYNISNWSSTSFNTWKTGVSNVSLSGNSLNVYPNPVRNEMVITIGGASTESGTISLLDMTGKVLKTQSVTGNKVTINVTELPAGMYMAQYTSDTRREQVKFNKQ